MSEYKEFTGKGLDEAIQSACDHFGLERNKLEIEILSGGSSGIFGLVGKKKAVIKARPRGQVSVPEEEKGEGKSRGRRPRGKGGKPKKNEAAPPKKDEAKPPKRDEAKPPKKEAAKAPKKESAAPPQRDVDAPPAAEESSPQAVDETRPPASDEAALPVPEERSAPQPKEQAAPPASTGTDYEDEEPEEENFNRWPEDMERPLDDKELEQLIKETVTILIKPIVGEVPVEVIQTKDRIKVVVDDEEQAGLLIGREGQTINALQYLTNRIVAKQRDEQIKIQLDAGDYRERQDDKLRQMAMYLADKARTQNRPQSTKPLSSYHRRVVHLALQADESVSTRSKGDGPLKRVLISPKRERGRQQQ
ncbi:RNA-binding cell elongation regulator Jag/EloR [Desulfohalovibrio reitneri]|uniref:RNA-binding cell elongation regulator Jag/EloR n=1 Tax=Desulfohalovibrio reitneri TaxID=1307759 RepID=UPI0004A6DC46|nr:RNA-binding cell elongation regulator Jag/EloR [Desulfohalovibrio reitneri]